ncbi:hypothetical protein BT63DRAFT_456912 [Microthyrium microscopicum]|uniref:Uncharacterized protein n=1 Tax=Microthyrium microscopicum TaxID=703497 RepID=A0A6A6U7N9_9PEZI|nr:hypothetical protein BT63DRAFT_456912 [Microthyrium microscopicum]
MAFRPITRREIFHYWLTSSYIDQLPASPASLPMSGWKKVRSRDSRALDRIPIPNNTTAKNLLAAGCMPFTSKVGLLAAASSQIALLYHVWTPQFVLVELLSPLFCPHYSPPPFQNCPMSMAADETDSWTPAGELFTGTGSSRHAKLSPTPPPRLSISPDFAILSLCSTCLSLFQPPEPAELAQSVVQAKAFKRLAMQQSLLFGRFPFHLRIPPFDSHPVVMSLNDRRRPGECTVDIDPSQASLTV